MGIKRNNKNNKNNNNNKKLFQHDETEQTLAINNVAEIPKQITENIINVLNRIQTEYKQATDQHEKNRRIFGFSNIFNMVANDFNESYMTYIYYMFIANYGNNMPLSHVIFKKLVNNGVIIKEIHKVQLYEHCLQH